MKIKKGFGAVIVAIILSFGMSNSVIEAASPFKDLPETHASYEEAMKLFNEGIIQGFPDDTYRPYNRLTRNQGAIIIGRALDVRTDSPNTHTFTDVNSKVSGQEYIHALTNLGVFTKAEKFNPYNPLTRVQMAKILVESFGISGTSNKSFRDVPRGHESYDYVQALVGAGITTGTSANTFSPYTPISRIQMATFVSRTLRYLDEGAGEADFKKEAKEILDLTNAERRKQSLQPLKAHTKLQDVAMVKAKDMYILNYFEHQSPVHGQPWEMIDDANIKYRSAGENIATGYRSAKSVVDAWMASPGHKANILNNNYTHLGVGSFQTQVGNRTQTYHVQMFIAE